MANDKRRRQDDAALRLLCVAYLHGAGGAERQITLLANGLAQIGHEVHLAVIAENLSQYHIDDKVHVHDLARIEAGSNNRFVARYRSLLQLIKTIRPEVSIHYWLQSAYLMAAMPASIRGKIVYSERGDPGDSEYSGLLGAIRRITFKRCAGLVFQTECARSYFGEPVRSKSTVIGNPLVLPEGQWLKPCANREKKIVTVGRLAEQKDFATLLSAMAIVHSVMPDYRLEIFGDGSLKSSLVNQANELSINEIVRFYQPVEDIYEHVYNAAAFVLSSRYEGMPNALMEAMGLGVPCVSTDYRPSGAARELIHEDENGLIVPIGDAVALANSIMRILDNVALSKRLATNAQFIRQERCAENVFALWNDYLWKMSASNDSNQ